MELERKQIKDILSDLEKKMVIIVGSRQVGKTWIAKAVMRHFSRTLYLNWDNLDDRKIIKSGCFPVGLELVVFDEVHKMRQWKSFIKGIYDTKPEGLRMLVTGSAKLNALKNVGDAMTGRFFSHQILPFSIAELKGTSYEGNIERLLSHGGFPEPFLLDDVSDVDRWREQYVGNNIRAEVLDFATPHDIVALLDIVRILRTRVGSPISFKGISEDVGVSPATAKRYVQMLEDLHIMFSVRTYTKKIARTILKEPKIYFYDVSLVMGEGARLENLVAVSLYKHTAYLKDTKGKQWGLSYIRTRNQKEVDFALTLNDELQELIEVKTSDTSISPELKYFGERTGVAMTQVVKNTRHPEIRSGSVKVIQLTKFLSELAL